METVYKTAEASGLFEKNDIKVRINSYKHYLLGEGKKDFIHVFGHIMEGRTVAQKAALSRSIVEKLLELLPEVAILSMNISEFNLATYCNRALLHPDNPNKNRHFHF